MKVYFGADHSGNILKEAMKKELAIEGYEVIDLSPEKPEGGDDFTDYAFSVGEAVATDPNARGVLICGTGIGMSIAANKVKGARAALITDVFTAKRARQHNDANIATYGAQTIEKGVAIESVKYFLETLFSGNERYIRRNNKIKCWEDFH